MGAARLEDAGALPVSKKTTQKLFRTFHEFRNKKLFKFKTDDVNKIVIETRKTLFELQKSDSYWNLFKPETTKIKKIWRFFKSVNLYKLVCYSFF